jgi:hypothetical protein
MDWNIFSILVLLVINFPVYRFLFGLFFASSEDYDESFHSIHNWTISLKII